MCVCVCVTSLTATPLAYGYKVRYESQANAVLKVFDSWISLEIFYSKVLALFAYCDDCWHFLQTVVTSTVIYKINGELH